MNGRLKVSLAIAVISVMILGFGAMAVAATPAGQGASTSGVKISVSKNGNRSIGTLNGSMICKSNETKIIAQQLLLVVERLSNATERLIKSTNSTNRTISYYLTGKKYEAAAIKAYDNGSYCVSIRDSFRAMRYYKLAIMSVRIQIPIKPAIYYEAKGELRMMVSYSLSVKHLIEWLSFNGVNVTNVSKLYNETLAAFKKVEQDLKDNNMTALRKDLAIANEKRSQLDMALRNAMKIVVKHKAKFIVSRFLNWTKVEIQMLKQLANETNLTWMKAWMIILTNALEYLYQTVDSLAKSGNYMAALVVIRTHLHPIKRSVLLLNWAHHRKGHVRQWIPVHLGNNGTIIL